MRSVRVQNKEIIYMTPTIERVFIKERPMSYAYSNYHEVYASIKGEDRFLGRYKNREDAIAAMEEVAHSDFCSGGMFTMPEDKQACR